MNPPERHLLVDGTFRPADARKILLSLVKSKIEFHNLEKLSNEERFGRDLSQSERRLVELHKLHETLRALCDAAGETGQRVQVSGWLEVQLIPDPTPALPR